MHQRGLLAGFVFVSFGRMFAFAGPAYLVSVGYMDPGNWATDLAGGARFGHQLVWVLLVSNLMAVLLQTLAARLGVVTGRDLAQACRDREHAGDAALLAIAFLSRRRARRTPSASRSARRRNRALCRAPLR